MNGPDDQTIDQASEVSAVDLDQPPEAPVEAAPAEQPEWDGSAYALKFRGKPHVPQTRDELITLAQLGLKYNHVTGDLDKRTKEIDERAQTYKQYEEMDNLFKENPQYRNALLQWQSQWQNGQQATNTSDDQEGPPSWFVQRERELMDKISKLEGRYENWQSSTQDQEIQKEIDELKNSHPDVIWDRDEGDGTPLKHLLEFAHQKGGISLEEAYFLKYRDQVLESAKAAALKQAEEAKLKNKKNGVVDLGPSAEKPTATDSRPKNYNEAMAMAMADLQK